jgi:hypothetical protein
MGFAGVYGAPRNKPNNADRVLHLTLLLDPLPYFGSANATYTPPRGPRDLPPLAAITTN